MKYTLLGRFYDMDTDSPLANIPQGMLRGKKSSIFTLITHMEVHSLLNQRVLSERSSEGKSFVDLPGERRVTALVFSALHFTVKFP